MNQRKVLKVYYSGTIKGSPEPDPEFALKLVQFMKQIGVIVLSEHVAATTEQSIQELKTTKGFQLMEKIKKGPEPWFGIREQDLKWVKEADCLVALVNAPSLGVGMEIQYAIDKPRMGMQETPILCLIRHDIFPRLSNMIKGISFQENKRFELKEYASLEEAQEHIRNFLHNTCAKNTV